MAFLALLAVKFTWEILKQDGWISKNSVVDCFIPLLVLCRYLGNEVFREQLLLREGAATNRLFPSKFDGGT